VSGVEGVFDSFIVMSCQNLSSTKMVLNEPILDLSSQSDIVINESKDGKSNRATKRRSVYSTEQEPQKVIEHLITYTAQASQRRRISMRLEELHHTYNNVREQG